jgi:glycosyltransferase involved in cell wall biosynthesis
VKVSIIVAVYNEAPTVGPLLERVWAQALPRVAKEIIVIESNSTDGSRQIVEEFAARHSADSSIRIQVIHQPSPQGKGNAIRQGLKAASGDILMIQDADLEYDVADYPDLLEPIIEGRAAFVLGSRHMGPNGWKIRKFAHGGPQAAIMNLGGMLFHALFNALYGVHLTDPTTMHKVFRASCLDGLNLTRNRFDFDFELLAKLVRRGHIPLEVAVSYKSRGFDEGKKIRPIRDPLTWLVTIFSCRFARASRRAAVTRTEPAPTLATAKTRRPAHRPGTS